MYSMTFHICRGSLGGPETRNSNQSLTETQLIVGFLKRGHSIKRLSDDQENAAAEMFIWSLFRQNLVFFLRLIKVHGKKFTSF